MNRHRQFVPVLWRQNCKLKEICVEKKGGFVGASYGCRIFEPNAVWREGARKARCDRHGLASHTRTKQNKHNGETEPNDGCCLPTYLPTTRLFPVNVVDPSRVFHRQLLTYESFLFGSYDALAGGARCCEPARLDGCLWLGPDRRSKDQCSHAINNTAVTLPEQFIVIHGHGCEWRRLVHCFDGERCTR